MAKIKVGLKKLKSNAIIPTYGTEFSAGADLYALPSLDMSIAPGETVVVHTGLALEIPEGYAGFVFARSGLALKKGLAPANKVGVIDADYRGEIMVTMHNHSNFEAVVTGGERIAQIVILPYIAADFIVCEHLNETSRGTGGFGSTGAK